MEAWKSALYQSYVSTEQAQPVARDAAALRVEAFPYLERLIARHLPADRSVRIVDLGCGHGVLLHCLRSAGYAEVEGVDVSAEQVALAHRLGVAGVQQGELLEFVSARPQRFDVVLLMDVLEHLTRQELFDLLHAACAALRPGGRIVVHLPNGEGINGMRMRYGDLTHELCLTPRSAQQVLNATGFAKVRIYEDEPTTHSLKGWMRLVLWRVLTLPRRLLLLAETGYAGQVLSQNMLIVAEKAAPAEGTSR